MCHSEIHWEEQQEKRIERSFLKKQYLSTKNCKNCKNEYKPKKSDQVYCSATCSCMGKRKVNRPTSIELKLLLDAKTSKVKIGEKYGVSDNAVNRWIKSYGLISERVKVIETSYSA